MLHVRILCTTLSKYKKKIMFLLLIHVINIANAMPLYPFTKIIYGILLIQFFNANVSNFLKGGSQYFDM
jgi:hypothetical protein